MNTIKTQASKNDSVKLCIGKFYTKLAKDDNVIKKFMLGDQELPRDCEDKLCDKNITKDSRIYAIKSELYK